MREHLVFLCIVRKGFLHDATLHVALSFGMRHTDADAMSWLCPVVYESVLIYERHALTLQYFQ